VVHQAGRVLTKVLVLVVWLDFEHQVAGLAACSHNLCRRLCGYLLHCSSPVLA
jgi:hypothetical protein